MKILTQIGIDGWDRPVYKDQNGKLWKDITCGVGKPYFHTSTNNEFEGEPGWPLKGEYEIKAVAS